MSHTHVLTKVGNKWSKEMKQLATYRFRTKDPVIDIARTCVQIYAAQFHNGKFTAAMREISKVSGVSEACMNNWFYGATVSPIFKNVAAVVIATRHPLGVVAERKPALRLVKGAVA